MTGAIPQRVDVDTFLDGLQINRFHIIVLVLCTLLTAIDGYEIYVVGWVLPKLAHDFGVPTTAITGAMVAQQVGMLLGAFVIPPLADRIGRPHLLLLCFAAMMLCSLGILSATSLTAFTVFRFLTGLFGTAVIPLLVTLASETAPARLRSTFSTITVSGSMLGAAMGAAMQAYVLQPFGWHGAFWIAASLPALMLPLIWLFMPESLRALAARNPGDPALQQLARRMAPGLADMPVIVAPPQAEKVSGRTLLRDILGPGQTLKTLLIWGIASCCFLFVAMSQWKTTIYKDVMSLSWQTVAGLNLVNSLAGFVGMAMIGWFIDRLGFRRVMVSAFVLAALGAVLTGALAPAPVMFFGAAMLGLFQHGGQASMAALAAALYPPRHRATGVGWAYGAARGVAIAGPLLGSAMIASQLSGAAIFALLGVPLALAGLLTFVLMSLPGAPVVTRAQLRH